jgi:hypothetical protein
MLQYAASAIPKQGIGDRGPGSEESGLGISGFGDQKRLKMEDKKNHYLTLLLNPLNLNKDSRI